MHDYFKKILKQKSLPDKIEFQKKLIRSQYENMGIPTIELRKLSKSFTVIELPENDFLFDELLLYGFSIAYSKRPLEDKLGLIQKYINLSDSWALIDSFCSSFKLNKKELDFLYPFLIDNFQSKYEFRRRFALVMFLSQYIKRDMNLNKIPRLKKIRSEDLKYVHKELSPYFYEILDRVNTEFSDYYVSMAVAWLLCEMFLVNPKEIFEFLQDNRLDDQTFNRTIDKIIQSKVPEEEVKEIVKKFKRSKF